MYLVLFEVFIRVLSSLQISSELNDILISLMKTSCFWTAAFSFRYARADLVYWN